MSMGAKGTRHAKSDADYADRFWSHVQKTDTCWLWIAAKNKGYGLYKFRGKQVRAARYSWFLLHGNWPTYTIDHLCKVVACVNPEHLEDVTLRVNRLRAGSVNALKTHCPKGHPYSGKNLYMNGKRRNCMACNYVRHNSSPTWDVRTGE